MVLPVNPINTRIMNFERRQRIDQEFNYLYDDTTQDVGGYEDEENTEYGTEGCYQ